MNQGLGMPQGILNLDDSPQKNSEGITNPLFFAHYESGESVVFFDQRTMPLKNNEDPCLCVFDVDRTLTGYQAAWRSWM